MQCNHYSSTDQGSYVNIRAWSPQFPWPWRQRWHSSFSAVPTVPNAVCVETDPWLLAGHLTCRTPPARRCSRTVGFPLQRCSCCCRSKGSINRLSFATRASTARRPTLSACLRLSQSHTFSLGERCSHALRARPNLDDVMTATCLHTRFVHPVVSLAGLYRASKMCKTTTG